MSSPHASSGVLAFGYVAPNVTPRARLDMAQFWIEIGVAAHLEIIVTEMPSYAELTKELLQEHVDFAWLPPIPFVALERRKGAVPLVTHKRNGSSHFHGVLITHKSSGIRKPEEVVGKRAGWIDPHSASGYVLPRIELAALGIDPNTAFPHERFYRSHDALIRAVLERRADFGGTWLGRDSSGAIVRAPWQDMVGGEAIRIVQTFGAIPSDTIAARPGLALSDAENVKTALIAASKEIPDLVRDIFGVDEFAPWTAEGYDVLRRSTMQASDRGLIEGNEKGDRSNPPSARLPAK
jgi:phosphonate transport system substrate-binding protein